MAIYNAEKGYGLQLTRFEEQYCDSIIYRSTKQEIIELADKILITFGHKGLMHHLNDMQTEATCISGNKIEEHPLFENKYEIPAYFINLILEPRGLRVLGW